MTFSIADCLTKEHVMRTIELEELKLRYSELTVAEVLPARYFAEGHLPGAVHLPLEGLEEAATHALPNRNREVVLYCANSTCRNSHQAAERLGRLGYGDVRVFTGGKSAWQ